MTISRRTLIEQAIARGWRTERICTAYNLDPREVQTVRARMDQVNEEVPEEPGHSNKRPIHHGTRNGYVAHRNRGEYPCPSCNEASRQYGAKHRARKKAA